MRSLIKLGIYISTFVIYSAAAASSGTFDVPAIEAGYIWKPKVIEYSRCDITAVGAWSFGTGMFDADGTGVENKQCSQYHNGDCPSKTSKLGVLIAKDGEGIFRPIGTSGHLYVNKDDEIFFTINDVRGTFADNSGKITVNWQCNIINDITAPTEASEKQTVNIDRDEQNDKPFMTILTGIIAAVIGSVILIIISPYIRRKFHPVPPAEEIKIVNANWFETSSFIKELQDKGYVFYWSNEDSVEEYKNKGYEIVYDKNTSDNKKYKFINKSKQVLLAKNT